MGVISEINSGEGEGCRCIERGGCDLRTQNGAVGAWSSKSKESMLKSKGWWVRLKGRGVCGR